MPSAAELQPLVGEELTQISLDPFSIQFKFDRWALTVEFEIEHIEPEGARHLHECKAQGGRPLLLHRLLQQSVISVERDELAFKLNSADGSTLSIRTELGPYECGQLYRMSEPIDMFVF